MNYLQFDLGLVEANSTVIVSLNTGANVRLMDSWNLSRYSRGDAHSYYGGLIDRSPARISVPRNGYWYVTVDIVGLRAMSVNAGTSVEAPPFPPTYARPRREGGYFSQDRGNGTSETFIGPDGSITSERPHVHVIHSKAEGRVILTATQLDGTHTREEYLPIDASAKQVQSVVDMLRGLLY